MMVRFGWIVVVVGLLTQAVVADNDFTYTGSPVAGQSFTITWTPGTYSTIDILLYSLTGYPYYVPTTAVPVAQGIPNSGSYVWNVPENLGGFYSLSIAKDFSTPVSYSPKFALGPYTISTINYASYTSVPQTTACTSALPAPTGPNPFVSPTDENGVLRVGVATEIQWQPTTQGTVSLILNPSNSNSYTIASATILSNISNSGSFAWTPPNDSILDGTGIGGWYLTLVDDATGATSTSASFNILTPDDPNEFIGPYPPLVLGQDHTFNWSPSKAPTISLLIKLDEPYGRNITLADHIQNTGTFTWSVPSSDPFITPGEWVFALVDDATGATDAMIYLVIDATTPAVCGPQTSNAVDSQIASFRSALTKNNPSYTPATPTTTNASLMSLLASLSAANAAKVTKTTPQVLTTLNPSNTGTKVGELQETQSGSGSGGGSVLSATSRGGAGGGRAGMGGRTGVWEISSGIFGLCVGILGVFL
ncbi:hypothetical protein L207DRAFT_518274 [Hyaloscypha variabilis F]|uniref:Yeast cell wall synthesis Kre9/Knh1-like N-terminal domain-containing protein n=1 Tax=Hyaloscypha variabilis (strain UAMH 11265 / GT02V1 / F) TaxID=1149755 RepID=A0A2J6R2W4_HYAVF|nr:hypothetical protein L207DRAFT_518274 [Hyaloscypha variabilis F]